MSQATTRVKHKYDVGGDNTRINILELIVLCNIPNLDLPIKDRPLLYELFVGKVEPNKLVDLSFVGGLENRPMDILDNERRRDM